MTAYLKVGHQPGIVDAYAGAGGGAVGVAGKLGGVALGKGYGRALGVWGGAHLRALCVEHDSQRV